jgi:hypothetical protein
MDDERPSPPWRTEIEIVFASLRRVGASAKSCGPIPGTMFSLRFPGSRVYWGANCEMKKRLVVEQDPAVRTRISVERRLSTPAVGRLHVGTAAAHDVYVCDSARGARSLIARTCAAR